MISRDFRCPGPVAAVALVRGPIGSRIGASLTARGLPVESHTEEDLVMTTPQDQFAELTRRTQENFKHLWEQWSQRSSELLKGVGGRSRTMSEAPGNPEEVLDAVFDFAENLIAQQRLFAKQMLRAAGSGPYALTDPAAPQTAGPTGVSGTGGPDTTPPDGTLPPG
jgi:hypothetical protein